jgi:hypothetical protein
MHHANLLILFQILVGRCSGTDKAISYDPAMIMGQDNIKAIICARMQFNVV